MLKPIQILNDLIWYVVMANIISKQIVIINALKKQGVFYYI